MTDDICLLTLSEQSKLIATRQLSAIELTDAHLRRIERLDGSLRSFLLVTAERAQQDARNAEAEISKGQRRGPLHGIPIGLKDLIDTAGIATTANSNVLAGRIPDRDATIAARLREAGTVLLGKLHLNEFATGKAYRDDSAPPPRNPWDVRRSAGGSSSGSAVATATGLVSAAIGSDTGGSIRAPAAWCGVVGFKPSYGLVSRRGVIALAWSLDHLGPLTRTVADAALVLQSIAGHDPDDPGSASFAVPDYSAGLGGALNGLRVGVPSAFIASLTHLEPDVRTSFGESLKVFRELGAKLVDVELPDFASIQAIFLAICGAESLSFHGGWVRTRKAAYGRGAWERLMQGLLYSGVEYVDAQRARSALIRSLDDMQRGIDILATPAMPRTAPTFEEYEAAPPLPRAPFLDLANVIGAPAISVPCGFDRLGLPIGLNLMARRFEDAALLRAAAAFEQATGWHDRHPSLDGLTPS